MKRNEIAQLFPAVFQRTLKVGNPLAALLEVVEVLQAPSEDVLQQLTRYSVIEQPLPGAEASSTSKEIENAQYEVRQLQDELKCLLG